MTAAELIRFIERRRFQLGQEVSTQDQMAEAFRAAGLPARAEVRLSARDRIDFVIGRIGLEVKVQGGKRAILRQIERYAESDELDEIVLVTNVAMGMPAAINGKRIHVASLGRGWM